MMLIRIAMLCVLSPFLCGVAHSTEKMHLRIGVEDMDYYPVMDFTADQSRGLLSDIIMGFGDTYDISLEFIPLPLKRFNHWFEEHAIDLRLPDNPNWSQEATEGLKYGDTLVTICDTSVVLAENRDINIDEVTRLGILAGFIPAQQWQQKQQAGSLTVASERSARILTRMLLNGLIDAIDLNIATIKEELSSLGLSENLVTVATNIPAEGVAYRISTLTHPHVLDMLNQYVADNRAEITTKAINYGIISKKNCNNF